MNWAWPHPQFMALIYPNHTSKSCIGGSFFFLVFWRYRQSWFDLMQRQCISCIVFILYYCALYKVKIVLSILLFLSTVFLLICIQKKISLWMNRDQIRLSPLVLTAEGYKRNLQHNQKKKNKNGLLITKPFCSFQLFLLSNGFLTILNPWMLVMKCRLCA